MTLEPLGSHRQLDVAAADEVEVNDPLWKDVGRKTRDRLIGRIPIVGDALVASLEVTQERAMERRIRLLEDAASRRSLSIEEFVDRLTDDEDLAELFWRAWNAAGHARSKEKIRLLAAAVAAVSAGERLNVSSGHVLVGVIEGLEPIHLQTLADIDREAAKLPPIEEGGGEGTHGARRAQLEELTDLDPEVLGIVIADLQSKQLVANAYEGTWGGIEGKEAFVLTMLGDQIGQLLLSVADEVPPESPG